MEHAHQGQHNPTTYLIRDPLTGAYTRGLMESRLIEETARSEREKLPFVLCVITPDHLSQVRELWGQDRANQLLRHLTERIQQKKRTSDVLFRSGPEEFVLMLPSTCKRDAVLVCERLLEHLATHPFEGHPVLFQRVSMGIAAYPEDAGRVSDLLQVARTRNQWASEQNPRRFVTEDLRDVPVVHSDPLPSPIERNGQLEAFQTFLDMLEIKQKGVFSLTGKPGSGRTFMLHFLAQQARRQNYAVLSLSGATTHRSLDGLMQAKWDAPLPVHEGSRAVLQTLQHGCYGKLGLLIMIDEGSMLDHATCRVIQQALDQLMLPVGIVMASVSRTALTPFQVPLETRVFLSPFSQQGVHLWMEEMLAQEIPARLSAWCFQQSEGYPGRATEVLNLLKARGVFQKARAGWELSSGWESYINRLQNQ